MLKKLAKYDVEIFLVLGTIAGVAAIFNIVGTIILKINYGI